MAEIGNGVWRPRSREFRETREPGTRHGLQFRLPCSSGLVTLDSPFFTYDRNNSQTFKMAVVVHRRPHDYFIHLLGRRPGNAQRRRRQGTGDFGSIYGHKITPEAYLNARTEVLSDLLVSLPANGRIKTRIIPRQDLEREIYLRLMLMQKAARPGHSRRRRRGGDGGERDFAHPRSCRRSGRTARAVPLEEFVKAVLQPEGPDRRGF